MRGIKILFCSVAVALGLSVAVLAASAGTTAAPPGTPAGPPAPMVSGQPADAAPTDIHDIRHPVQVGVNPAIYYWSIGVAAVLLSGLVAWILIRRWKRKDRRSVSDVTATIFRSPEEEFLAGLDELAQNRPDPPALFYFRLSALFRHYLQGRFNVDAPEMTTEELLPHLAGLDLDRKTQAGLKTFLKFGDQVKFARAVPDPVDMNAHLNLVREVADRFLQTESAAEEEGGA